MGLEVGLDWEWELMWERTWDVEWAEERAQEKGSSTELASASGLGVAMGRPLDLALGCGLAWEWACE